MTPFPLAVAVQPMTKINIYYNIYMITLWLLLILSLLLLINNNNHSTIIITALSPYNLACM